MLCTSVLKATLVKATLVTEELGFNRSAALQAEQKVLMLEAKRRLSLPIAMLFGVRSARHDTCLITPIKERASGDGT